MLEKYKKKMKKLTLSFAFSTPAHMVATFFGAGLLRPAPGTWATAIGLALYGLLEPYLGLKVMVAATAALFAAGVWSCSQTGRDIGEHDHGAIVIDEVFASWAVALTVSPSPVMLFAAFLVFRFFDIVKIWPASLVDSHMQNGFGVMLDDAVSAVYSALTLWALQSALQNHFFWSI